MSAADVDAAPPNPIDIACRFLTGCNAELKDVNSYEHRNSKVFKEIQRMAQDAVSNNIWWKQYCQGVITDITNGFGSDTEKSLAILAIGASMGSSYLSALQGRPISERIFRQLGRAIVGLRSDCPIFHHGDILTLADYISAARANQDDIRVNEMLQKVYGDSMITKETLADAVSKRGASLKKHPIVAEGISRIQSFAEKVIMPSLHPSILERWSWADVLIVAIIILTSILWERRLIALPNIESRFTMSLFVAIGRHIMNTHHVNKPSFAIYDIDALMTLSTLRIIADADSYARAEMS